jgi:DNA-binding response OmpR family regulator
VNKILFIEDDIPTQQIYKDRFSRDYKVFMVRDGEGGVKSALKNKPDAIVLDILLSGSVDGFDVLRKLKGKSASKDIPVIVLTNLEAQEKKAKTLGANECLVKANTPIGRVEKTLSKYF